MLPGRQLSGCLQTWPATGSSCRAARKKQEHSREGNGHLHCVPDMVTAAPACAPNSSMQSSCTCLQTNEFQPVP